MIEFFWRLVWLVLGFASIHLLIAMWLLPVPWWGAFLMGLPFLFWMLWTWERTKTY